ncbi:hypothetical protein BC628DRAFT_91155 [Trametes gibbosa]|nr:hypothetical protein BC628DRAFT_91155 [Trametes gibbosa]
MNVERPPRQLHARAAFGSTEALTAIIGIFSTKPAAGLQLIYYCITSRFARSRIHRSARARAPRQHTTNRCTVAEGSARLFAAGRCRRFFCAGLALLWSPSMGQSRTPTKSVRTLVHTAHGRLPNLDPPRSRTKSTQTSCADIILCCVRY